jgi:RNA dependent RNA polymerase
MLTIKQDFPPDKIGIRPSMCKFSSKHRLLEVKTVAIGKSGPNKSLFFPALLIMHHQGVPSEVFMDLQRRAWAEIALQWDRDAAALFNEPVDFNEISRYMQGVVKHGRKAGKEPFTLEELKAIIHRMEEAKKSDVKVNLHCAITLMQGVVDEHNVLEEGEVLVGNGKISGDILILRPPCTAVGDIQRVKAVPKRREPHFKMLSESLVFSAKGDRPLADMLGGGDLDGDEMYIVSEKMLVESFNPAPPCDFGSQKDSIPETVSMEKIFSVRTEDHPPLLSDQLDVLQHYMTTGDIVAASAEAWARLADVHGPTHPRTLIVSNVCQRALDARKNGCVFTDEEIEEIDKVLSEHHPDRIDKPRWRGGPDTNPAQSILGSLFDKWEEKINAIKATRDHRQNAGPSEDSSVYEGSVVSEITQDTRQFDGKAGKPAMGLGKTGTEILIDCVFGQKDLRYRRIVPIDFTKIDEKARVSLVAMVLQEFESALNDERAAAERRYYAKDYTPREYEVFLIKKKWCAPRLAVAVPVPRTDDQLEFRVEDGILEVNDPDFEYRRRVSSLSGFARVLDSIMCNPVPHLMEQAMSRSALVDIVSPETVPMDSTSLMQLNRSQLEAVATVLSPSFQSGFFAIQGVSEVSNCCSFGD